MKKFSFLLSVILVFCLAFLTSCSSIFDSSSGGATVSFRLNQDAVNALTSKISSSRAGVPAELADTTLSVTLYVNNKPVTQEAPLTQNGVLITFPHIIVGSKVSAFVQVKKGADLLAAGTSSETIRVKKGENLLSVTLRYAADGQLFFGDHVTIQLVASNASNEIWLNKGEWTFKLLDDAGNDILADVDWEARDESEPNNPLINDYLISVVPSVVKGHTPLFGESDYLSYFSIENNKLSLKQNRPLSQSGTLELTVTIRPGSETYMNKSGKMVPFPQFEPVSTTVEINVNSACRIDISNFDQNNFVSNITENLNYFNSYTGDLTISLSGTTSLTYNAICEYLRSAIVDRNSIYGLDISDVTSTSTDKALGYSSQPLQGCEKFSSLILPEDVSDIYNDAFLSCTKLKKVRIGSKCKQIGDTAFAGCIQLETIEIPDNSDLKKIGMSALSGTNISKFEVPKNVISIGQYAFPTSDSFVLTMKNQNGTWYSVEDQTIWEAWNSGERTVPDTSGTQFEASVEADIINTLKNGPTVYLYCVR